MSLDVAEADDEVLALVALHLAADELAHARLVLVVEDVALGLADALGEALLDRLGHDAPQLAHLELVHALVVLDGHLAGLPVDRADEILALAEALAHGGSHRLLERAEDHLVGDVLLRVQEIDHLQECFGIHVSVLGGNRKGAGDAPLLPAAWRVGPGKGAGGAPRGAGEFVGSLWTA